MQGVRSFDEALSLIAAQLRALPSESVSLCSSLGRFLAENVVAKIDSPRFDNSAVDGYALGHGEGEFDVVGESAAGSAWKGPIGQGEAIRIFTGAPVPEGTRAIAMVEDCREENGRLTVHLAGDHVRRRGEDYGAGQTIARRGDLLSPPMLGLLASAGICDVEAPRLPRVTLVTTGDETVPLGATLGESQIYDSNAVSLRACLTALGIQAEHVHLPDDPAAIASALRKALQTSDILLTCGGISVGAHDHLKTCMESEGVEQVFWRAAIKPGKPIYFGTKGGTLVFGLPGNPISALITFYLFARPAILRLMGCPDPWPRPFFASLDGKLKKSPGRTEFVRARLQDCGGPVQVVATAGQESHMLLGTSNAECLIVFPAAQETLEAGASVQVIPLRWGLT